jgi:predicted ATPase
MVDIVSPETREVLRIAACLGDNNFSLVLLSRVMNLGIFEVARRMWPAQQIGLISSDQSLQVHTQLSHYINKDAIDGNGVSLVLGIIYPRSRNTF